MTRTILRFILRLLRRCLNTHAPYSIRSHAMPDHHLITERGQTVQPGKVIDATGSLFRPP